MSDTMTRKTPLAAHLVRKVSVAAPADPRSIRKLLRGEPLSPMTAERIRRALEDLGLAHLVPSPAAECER
jgi:hypothetical protein